MNNNGIAIMLPCVVGAGSPELPAAAQQLPFSFAEAKPMHNGAAMMCVWVTSGPMRLLM